MFEDIFNNVRGDVRRPRVYDPEGITPPKRIIQTDDEWKVKARWYIDDVGAPFLGGTWTVRLFAEALGPGTDKELATQDIDLDEEPATLPRKYKYTFEIPAYDDDPANSLPPGVYKLVTVVNYSNLGVPLEMAGFHEGPIIQIYEEGH